MRSACAQEWTEYNGEYKFGCVLWAESNLDRSRPLTVAFFALFAPRGARSLTRSLRERVGQALANGLFLFARTDCSGSSRFSHFLLAIRRPAGDSRASSMHRATHDTCRVGKTYSSRVERVEEEAIVARSAPQRLLDKSARGFAASERVHARRQLAPGSMPKLPRLRLGCNLIFSLI